MPPRLKLPTDPFLAHYGSEIRSDQRGRIATTANHRGDRGTVLEVHADSYTYKVITERKIIHESVGRLVQDPGDKVLLTVGTPVAISEDYGIPLIVGVLPFTSTDATDETRINITGVTGTGGDDPLSAGKGVGNFKTPNTPTDLGPEDWARVGPEGNALAVLRGGVNIMKSGVAQFRTHLLNDLAEVICRNFRQISDMGTMEIKNDAGRMNWSFRGGVDQATEAGIDQENWTIRIDLGAKGNLFNFELSDPGGKSLFKFHVTVDGRLEMIAIDGIDELCAGDHLEQCLKNHESTVHLDEKLLIKGSRNDTVQGDRTTQISGKDIKTVGVDGAENYVRNHSLIVGGQQTEKIIGGNPLVAKPGDIARETYINNGTWKVIIGDPTTGANPIAKAGLEQETYTGSFSRNVKIKGDITDTTLLGNVEMATTAGKARFGTSMGVTELSGTTIHHGNIGASSANPIIKGTVFVTALGSYLSALEAACGGLAAACSGLASDPKVSSLAGPVGAAAAACQGAASALAGALTGTLSKKNFVE